MILANYLDLKSRNSMDRRFTLALIITKSCRMPQSHWKAYTFETYYFSCMIGGVLQKHILSTWILVAALCAVVRVWLQPYPSLTWRSLYSHLWGFSLGENKHCFMNWFIFTLYMSNLYTQGGSGLFVCDSKGWN